MRYQNLVPTLIAVAAFFNSAALLKPVSAAPLTSATVALTSSAGLEAQQVRWRHGGGGAVAAGLVTGLMIGGLLAAPGYYDPYPYYPYRYYGGYYAPRFVAPIGYGSQLDAYCISRFRSYDPISGTYLGRDGRRHYCG